MELSNRMKISLIVLIAIPIIIILFFIGIIIVNAEEMQMTASDGYWYNSAGSQVLQVQASSVNRNSEPFYVYQGSTSVQTQFLRAVMYFPETQNDNVLDNQWDISFVVLGYGNFSLVVGGAACYTISTGTNYNSAFIWRSNGVYSNGQTAEDTQGNISTENSPTSPLWRSVYCPNVKFNRVPTEVKMFRDWHDSSDNSRNRIFISKYWYLRKTINDNSSVESAINNQTSTINNSINQTNGKLDEMNNADISNNDKQQVDQTEYNNYKNKETSLINTANQADLSNLQIGIDTNTSGTIWDLITRIIQSNAKIFTLFIAILSIGIIKIALAR